MTADSINRNLKERWLVVLVAIQGVWLLAMGLVSDGAALALGVIGGILLILAPVLARGPWWVYPAIVAVGSLPFALMNWWAIVPLIVAIVAVILAIVFAHGHRATNATASQAPLTP